MHHYILFVQLQASSPIVCAPTAIITHYKRATGIVYTTRELHKREKFQFSFGRLQGAWCKVLTRDDLK